MASMTYCRHENTASELAQVWELWEDYEPGSSQYEDRGRARIVKIVREMHEQFEFDGTYDEIDGVSPSTTQPHPADLLTVANLLTDELEAALVRLKDANLLTPEACYRLGVNLDHINEWLARVQVVETGVSA